MYGRFDLCYQEDHWASKTTLLLQLQRIKLGLLTWWIVSCFGAGKSLEPLNIVLALSNWIGLLVILIAFLHSLEHVGALGVDDTEWSTSKVRSEEVSERWHVSSRVYRLSESLGPGSWSWWGEETGVREFKSFKIWMLKITRANLHTLEWMTNDHKWMCVI